MLESEGGIYGKMGKNNKANFESRECLRDKEEKCVLAHISSKI
jgi:hypothetical protein